MLESLLFASDRPLTVNDLKRLVGERDGAKLSAALDALRARREQEASGVQVIEVAGGWHLRTNPANVAWVSRLVAGRPQRLTRAMLETLSIVAYRQPITRPEIDDMRGVDCGPVLKTLLDRGLVRMIGKKEEAGRPILYGTTPEFLRIFSLKDLAELPTLREFHELGADDMAKVDAAAPLPGDAAAPAEANKPAPVVPRELDPEEDDELLTELERAAAAAAKAGGGDRGDGDRADSDRRSAAAGDGIAPRASTKIPGPGGGRLAKESRGADRVGRSARQRRGGDTLGTSVGAKDRVDVNGRRVVAETPIYRLMLKPRACLATLAKSGARPTLARYRARRGAGSASGRAARLPRGGGRVADHRRRAGPGDGQAGQGADDLPPQAAGARRRRRDRCGSRGAGAGRGARSSR